MSFALFQNNSLKPKTQLLFSDNIATVSAYSLAELETIWQKISYHQQQGKYLAGFISYDAALYLNKLITTKIDSTSKEPLIYFEVYNKLERDLQKPQIIQKFALNSLQIKDTYNQYLQKYNCVQQELIKGNTYELNLTTEAILDIGDNSLFAVYKMLIENNPIEYGAYLDFEPVKIASLSPELFFHKIGNNITLKPMKGTYPRHQDKTIDLQYYNQLLTDEKNRAENLIIVDLLRNDLSIIAQTGSVRVNELFQVTPFPDVWQMTSTISATIDVALPFEHIINALFPCGSITGAPKLSTMQLINSLENYNRGIYTGAIGYILPNNDMLFNVAIRTLSQVKGNNYVKLGAGGGITIKSNPIDEWQEIHNKLKFVSKFCQ
jgi:para-aminobenzoate synthetase/4-amino-4-deoxychorismate lyase